MYNDYFGFRDAPFSIAPNPDFLYLSDRHREALAHLLYGIRTDGGFVLLSGEVGTGKTTVCRRLLDELPEDVDIAFILNPKLSAAELLATICDELGVTYPASATVKQLTDNLNRHLLEANENDRRVVVIIDEAQNLDISVLEQLRLLTNLETRHRKLLQIILLGQPELLDLLARPELRQLSQRITARYHLDALQRDEIGDYIRHRLAVAGSHGKLFTDNAVAAIYRHSGGVPRLINLICDRALLGTYAENGLVADQRTIRNAAHEISGQTTPPGAIRWAGFAALILMAAVMLLIVRQLEPEDATPATQQNESHEVTTIARTSLPPGDTAAEPRATGPDPETTVTPPMLDAGIASAAPTLAFAEGQTMARAFANIATLWQASGNDCDALNGTAHACLTLLGSYRDLLHLDRPAVLRLTDNQRDYFLAATAATSENVQLASGAENYRVPAEQLNRYWTGEFTLIWTPPAFPLPIMPRERTTGIRELTTRLARFDSLPASSGTTYDPTIVRRVERFQLSRGLRPDGIVGARTWIHLNQLTGLDAPTLRTATGAD